ncbi:MAG: DUF2905 family protein [Bryobacterales bacterium]|nr:DUF2905 family protein [Bryobacterales bacterium]
MKQEIGRALVLFGIVLSAVGFLFLFGDKLPLGMGRLLGRLGRLPGDIRWKGEHGSFYFPLTTCLLLSALLSLIFWLFGRR